ncbi:MAG: LysR family transcriptional regulator [Myxococcota bacterium]
MPRLTGVPSFVQVAERQSFRAAARALGVTPTAVSKAVARLEDHLGVQLLRRTSRSVTLTPEGARYLAHCRAALARLVAGEEELTQATRVARGVVRASLSVALGRIVVPGLPRLRERHPRLELELSFRDEEVSVASDDVDVAVRIGALVDSALVARRLRTTRWVTVASPHYLARSAPLRTPSDLAAHQCLRFARPGGGLADFRFRSGSVAVGRNVVLDHGDLLVDAAVAGLGVTQAMGFMVAAPLARGDLVAVLAEEGVAGPPLHALTLRTRARMPRVRALLDFFGETFG